VTFEVSARTSAGTFQIPAGVQTRVTVTEATGWTGKFEHLPSYDSAGNPISYDVSEVPEPSHYQMTSKTGDMFAGFSFENTERNNLTVTKEILNDEGKAFASFYYDFYAAPDSPCYPEDVDRVALEYFGKEKYECEEFADEAYLFMPYGDEYYGRISTYISRNHRIFYGLD
jgi:hypothetical protein